MRSHLKSVAKKKVSDFRLREEGVVGNRTAFTAAAFVGATVLAMYLFVSQDTSHPKWCPGHFCHNEYLCCWNGNPRVGNYTCIAGPGPPRPYDCW